MDPSSRELIRRWVDTWRSAGEALERIKTTEPKAKELKAFAEKLITLAKRGDLHARRQIISHLYDIQIAHKLVDELAPRMSDRSGGYVRLFHLGPRRGDSAPMAQLELVL